MIEPVSRSGARPFSLWVYLAIVFALSWPFQIAAAVWDVGLLSRYVLHAASMCMVGVGTFIAGRYVFRDGFTGAGWRWGRLKHYVAVAALVALLWLLPSGVALAMGKLSLPEMLTRREAGWALLLLFVTVIPAFGEEFGWRGYMLPRLAAGMGVRWAVFLHGLIWWAWHIPMLAGAGLAMGAAAARQNGLPEGPLAAFSGTAVVLGTAVPAAMHGVVVAGLWSWSGSLAVATVYHALYDGVRDSIDVVVGSAPMSGIWAASVLTLLGALLLWKGRWQSLAASARQAQPAAGRREEGES
jgi:membrane protease YdiL (CAAX protease family)